MYCVVAGILELANEGDHHYLDGAVHFTYISMSSMEIFSIDLSFVVQMLDL